jgi:hypothetical protein
VAAQKGKLVFIIQKKDSPFPRLLLFRNFIKVDAIEVHFGTFKVDGCRIWTRDYCGIVIFQAKDAGRVTGVTCSASMSDFRFYLILIGFDYGTV